MTDKKTFLKTAFYFLLSGFVSFVHATPDSKETTGAVRSRVVAVLPFVTLGEDSPEWLSEGVASYLRHNLQGLRHLLVPTEAEVAEAIRRSGISFTKQVEIEKLDRFREITAADSIVLGAVQLKENKVLLKIKVLALDQTKKVKELEVKGGLNTLNLLLQESTAQIAGVCQVEVAREDRMWMVAPAALKPASFKTLFEARRLASKGDLENAIRAYQEALARSPRFSEASLQCGVVLKEQKNDLEAESVFKRGVGENPNSVELPVQLAQLYFDQGKTDLAKALIDTVLIAHPQEPHALLSLARIYVQKGFKELALDTLEKGIRFSARKDEYYILLGDIHRDKGNLSLALSLYEKAVQVFPSNSEALQKQGITLAMMGEYDKALDFLSSSSSKNSPSRQQSASRQPQNSVIEEYLLVLSKDPNDVAAYNSLAAAYEQEGEWDLAIESYRKAIKINPNFAPAYFNLAVNLVGQGKLEEAKTHYLRAIELNPRHLESLKNLGALYWRIGQVKQAQETWEKAFGIKPDDTDVAQKLAGSFARQGKWKNVLAVFEAVEKASGIKGQAALLIGKTYLSEGKNKKALDYFKQSAKEAPQSPEPYKELAVYYEKIAEDRKKALAYYELFLTKEASLDQKKEAEAQVSRLKQQLAKKE